MSCVCLPYEGRCWKKVSGSVDLIFGQPGFLDSQNEGSMVWGVMYGFVVSFAESNASSALATLHRTPETSCFSKRRLQRISKDHLG